MDSLRCLALLFLTAACSSLIQAAQCPAFATSKAACGADTCGRYVFRGKFQLAASRQFRVRDVKNGVRLGAQAEPGDCCRECREHSSCAYWNFLAESGACYLYTSDLCSTFRTSQPSPYVPNVAHSYVGGKCHQTEEDNAAGLGPVKFPLLPHRAFCLISDPELHINMQLSGYLDQRTAVLGAVKPRVWITEIGLLWAHQGQTHSIRFVARRSTQQERGSGFLDRIEVDGVPTPTLMLGDEVNLFEGQASVLFDAYEKVGGVDVDKYSVKIEGVIEADIRARAAHPLLQHAEDAMVHLNLDIAEVHHSDDVHGVLGQSYRGDSDEEQNLDYNTLSRLIGAPHPSSSSSKSDDTFSLEGAAEDYWSSSVLQPDCKFSRFHFTENVALPQVADGQEEDEVAVELKAKPLRSVSAAAQS